MSGLSYGPNPCLSSTTTQSLESVPGFPTIWNFGLFSIRWRNSKYFCLSLRFTNGSNIDGSNAVIFFFASFAAFNGVLNDVKAEADDIYQYCNIS